MKFKRLIAEAWDYTQHNKKLIGWYAFVPAFLSTLIGILYIGYQFFAFKTSHLFENAETSFFFTVTNTLLNFATNNQHLTLPLIIVAIIIGVIYLLWPVFCEASLIQYIARARHNQKISIADGFKFGALVFLPFFEYSLIIKTFSFVSISGEISFVVRNLGIEIFKILSPLFIIIFIVALVLYVLFTFAQYYIVIDNEQIIKSMWRSCTLVILNIQHTFLLLVLMIIIIVRIIIQLLLVIVIPAIFILGVAYFATVSIPQFAWYIFGIISLVSLVFASYLSAVVHVFATAVWTFTFLKFTEEKVAHARDVHQEPTQAPPQASQKNNMLNS